MRKFLTLLIMPLLIISCANPLNRMTAQQYYNGGNYHKNQGNWFDARISYGRAWTNTEWGNLSPQETALYAFEFGRASGALCDWENAEKGLRQAYNIDIKTGAPLHYDLIEFAHMYQAMGLYEKSDEYYSMTLASFNEDIINKHPMGYADTLKRYSDVLSHLGKDKMALDFKKRSEVILSANPDKTIPPGIPYGKFCHQSSEGNG